VTSTRSLGALLRASYEPSSIVVQSTVTLKTASLGNYIEAAEGGHRLSLTMYEKFEAELAALKATADARTRASQRLALYRRAGEGKTILCRNLSLSSSEGPLPYLGL
jgi:hypothetical protein